jgi:hypothetical protein
MTLPGEELDPITRPNPRQPDGAGGGSIARDGSGTLLCGCEPQYCVRGQSLEISPRHAWIVGC